MSGRPGPPPTRGPCPGESRGSQAEQQPNEGLLCDRATQGQELRAREHLEQHPARSSFSGLVNVKAHGAASRARLGTRGSGVWIGFAGGRVAQRSLGKCVMGSVSEQDLQGLGQARLSEARVGGSRTETWC